MTAERFNAELADKAVGFIGKHLVHVEGECYDQPVKLVPWQEETFREVIGTQVYSDELGGWVRRYKAVYVEISRKNGKSLWLSAIAIYHLMADPTLRGQDIVCVACDKEQAGIVFDTAANMIEANPELEKRCYIAKRTHKRIENLKNGNRLFVIPGDAEGALGLRPAIILFDELLAQKKRNLFDALTTGQGASRQPLLWMITTAGEYGTLCFEQHEYGRKVQAGEIADPSFLFVRYGMDDGDDWTDRKVWRKANPSLGVTVLMGYLESKFVQAQNSLEAQVAFRKFYLNEWNLSETSWLDMAAWDACSDPVGLDDLAGVPCYIGVDLASRRDLNAVVGVFAHPNGHFSVLPRFYLPEHGIDDKARRDGVPYRMWAEKGFLTLTPGRTTDYGAVFEGIRAIADLGELVDVGYDEHNAGDLEAQLDKVGLPAYDVPQGFWLSEALKDVESAVLSKRIRHAGHPVLRWCANNAVIKMNEVERIKIVKKLDTKRIDGIAALANAFDRMRRHEDEVMPSIRFL
jgi:phage terminase large subunit-like protein